MSDIKIVDPSQPDPGPARDQQRAPRASGGGAGYGYGYGGGYGVGRAVAQAHLLDYVRVLHKRRWTAITAFVIVVLVVAIQNFRETPIYAARVQLLIEPENPKVVSFKEVLEPEKATNDYYTTQY